MPSSLYRLDPATGRGSAAGTLRRVLCVGLATAVVGAWGCGGGTKLSGPAGQDTTSGGGGLDRATLTVVVRLTGEDSAVASELGVRRGVLPGAEVRLRRRASGAEELTATTDSAGRATFDRLLEGRYDLSALRVLTQAEIGRLSAADGDVTGFGAAAAPSVAAPSTADTLEAVAGRRGSLAPGRARPGAGVGPGRGALLDGREPGGPAG